MRKAEIKYGEDTAGWLTQDEEGYHFWYDRAYLKSEIEISPKDYQNFDNAQLNASKAGFTLLSNIHAIIRSKKEQPNIAKGISTPLPQDKVANLLSLGFNGNKEDQSLGLRTISVNERLLIENAKRHAKRIVTDLDFEEADKFYSYKIDNFASIIAQSDFREYTSPVKMAIFKLELC